MPGRPFAWLALFLAGNLATLLLIHAGRLVGYQHYPPLPRLLHDSSPLLLGVFGVQALAVLWGVARARRNVAELLRRYRGSALLLVAAGFVLTSATLSRDPASYFGELAFASFVQLIQLGNILLLAGSLNDGWLAAAGRFFDRCLGRPGVAVVEPEGPDRWAWPLAGAVTLFAASLAFFVYQRHPHVPDEVVYLFHARYFAAGKLAMPLPPVPDAFSVDLMTYQATRWFSPVPPGWPAILALGARLGLPWLVDPILGGINILLAYGLLRELYPRRTARLATVLLAVSPWHLFMAMNFMTHTATLTCALAAALAVARLRRDPRLRWALLGGFFLGVIGLIRPLDGLTVALLLGVWSLGARGKRFRFAPSAALTVATAFTAALVFPYNRALTGSARVFPLMQYTDAAYGAGTNALGFGPNRGLGWPGVDPFPGHGPIDVAVNANFNLFQTNVELLGWATGSLLLLLLWLGSGRLRRSDWMMLSVIVLVAGIHSFYWFSGGPDFGARYWYLIILPCLALSARGLEYAEGIAEQAAPGGGHRVLSGAAVLVVAAVGLFVPWRAVDKYYHYRGMRPEARRLAAAPSFGNAIVLVRGRRFPDYASAVIYNPIDPQAPQPIFTWDRGAATRRRLVQAYPDRSFWVTNGPSLTGAAYEIVAGPLGAAELLARSDSLAPGP
jgi:4-amino-4-deoxy-L-arabinose transferase-like glycosyltransferase